MDDVPKLPSPSTDAIEALFSRFAATGDTSAFAAVYDATAPLLMRVARRIARGRGDAEDLIQATYVTAIERARVFDPARPLLPWLVGILAMHAKNAARRAARATSVGVPVVTVEPNQLEALIDLEERAAVAMAIADLPSPYREILDARRRPVDEGSIHGGRTPVLLRVHFHRALDRVRRLLPHGLLAAFPAFVRNRIERRAIQALRGRLLTRIQKPGLVSSASLTPLAIGSWLMWKKLVAGVLVLLAGWFVAAKLMLSSPSHDVDAASRVAEAPQLANDPIPPAETATPTTRDAVPPAAPDHRIHYRGRVIDGATLTPVAGAAVVTCCSFDGDPPIGGSTAITDAAGCFDIPSRDIGSGPEVRVFADGFAPLYRPIVFPGDTLAKEQGVDAGDLRLERGATVHGLVRDTSDRPVAGARLFLIDHPSEEMRPHLLDAGRPMGVTDGNGGFLLEHVRSSGTALHWVFVLHEQWCGCMSFRVAAGSENIRDVVIRLCANSPVVIEAVDDDGAPIVGALVAAVPIESPWPPFFALSSTHTKLHANFLHRTDASGRARFDIEPSTSRVFVVAETEGGGAASATYQFDHGSPNELRTRRLVLSSEARVAVSSSPQAPPERQPVGGIVVNETGAPVPDVEIRGLFGAKDGHPSHQTDEHGRFLVDAIKGHRTLIVDLPGGGSVWRKGRLILEIPEGDQHDLRIVGERIAKGVANVKIDVFDAESRAPFALVDARVFPRVRGDSTPRFIGAEPNLVSGVKGRLVIESARVGVWRMEVNPDASTWGVLDFDVKPGETSLHFDLPLAKPATVKGRVVARGIDDAVFAEILRHARIFGYEADGARRLDDLVPHDLATDERGRFEFSAVPSREVRLRFESPDAVGEIQIDARKGGDLFVEISVTRPALLRLRGIDNALLQRRPSLHLVPLESGDEGKHVHDQWIDLADPRSARTDTFKALPGTFRYELFGDLYICDFDFARRDPPLLASGTITLASGATAEIDVPLSPK